MIRTSDVNKAVPGSTVCNSKANDQRPYKHPVRGPDTLTVMRLQPSRSREFLPRPHGLGFGGCGFWLPLHLLPLCSPCRHEHLADSSPSVFAEHLAGNHGRAKPQQVRCTHLGQVGYRGCRRSWLRAQWKNLLRKHVVYRREGAVDPDTDGKGHLEDQSAPSKVRHDLRGLPGPWEQWPLYSHHQIVGQLHSSARNPCKLPSPHPQHQE